jgi:hypothetical protein
MDNQILIITGMHKSGTSLVTQWLVGCGLCIAIQPDDRGIGNEDALYEDQDFDIFHRNLLNARGLSDSGLVETPIAGMTLREQAVAAALITEKNTNDQSWGWNDPKACLFLNDYKELIPEGKFLIVYRDFQSTVSALINSTYLENHQFDEPSSSFGLFKWLRIKQEKKQKIKAITREKATEFLKVWLLYNREILKLIDRVSNDRFVVVNYESLLNEDHQVLAVLRHDWDFSLDDVRFRTVFKPDFSEIDIKLKPYVPEWLIQEATDITLRLKKLTVDANQPV